MLPAGRYACGVPDCVIASGVAWSLTFTVLVPVLFQIPIPAVVSKVPARLIVELLTMIVPAFCQGWTGAIVSALTERPMRFGELGRAVPGLSDRLLSQRLRELEEEGLVEREVEAGTPVRVTYSLTEVGVQLGPSIRELRVWAKLWKEAA